MGRRQVWEDWRKKEEGNEEKGMRMDEAFAVGAH